MKKILSLLIGLTLVFTANFVIAADEPSEAENEILKKCQDKKPKYEELINLNKPYEGEYNLNFRLAFEKARTDYHEYMKCVFDQAAINMLASAGGDTEGVGPAVLIDMLPDLLKPETACLKQKDLVNILKHGSPKSLLTPLLEAYYQYAEYLEKLYMAVSDYLQIDETTDYSKLYATNQAFSLIIENEIQDAFVTLDASFTALKEMRQAFTIHVHFQCMLKNLEAYRRVLEKLRTVIESLPPIIENASMHK